MSERGVATLMRRWWSGELGAAGSALAIGLAPAEALYRGAVAARNAAFDSGLRRVYRAGIPVISVGNVAVGGTGKTPVAQFLAQRLRERGERPAILHGGYAADEPLLHRHWSKEINVIVDADRVRGAHTARAQGANVVVLDDGFQHRRLHRDLDLVLVAAERWDDAQRLLPRGPWREPRAALQRADLVMVTRKVASAAHAGEVRAQLERFTQRAILLAHLAPSGWQHRGEQAPAPIAPAVAVAALAEPQLFAESARLAGATIELLIGYDDHHAYGSGDARKILERAAGAPIVTTEKDWVKLQALLPLEQVWVLTQQVRIELGAAVLDARLSEVMRMHDSAQSVMP